ncbi:MAG: class I SAM-dependent methyltransferase [Roseovarius sp.]
MGVDYVLFDRLAELSTRFKPTGRTLMLGRQAFGIQTTYKTHYEASLAEHGLSGNRFDFLQDDGFAETLMRKLGFGEIETMDFSTYEGATVIHDLNQLPAPELENQFDFIFDGGTIEHVFNVPNALEGIYRMLKPGGRFVSANGFSGWHNHGMYQFTPELVWTFWRRACNARVVDCRALPALPKDKFPPLQFRDPAETGQRLKLRGKIAPGRTYLYYEVEKTKDSHLPDFALQSDYETKWQGHENAGQTRLQA